MRDGAILLIGGRSTRMGAAKADLDWRGRPLAAHLAAVLREAVDGPVVAVAAPDQTAPALPADVELVRDAVADDGPLRGMQAGFAALDGRTDRVAVVSVDLPLLAPAFVRMLLDALEGDVDAVVPVVDGHRHPLAAGYRSGVATAVDAALADGVRAPMALLERLAVRWLDDAALTARLGPGATRSLLNVNTPEELERARSSI